MRIFIEKKILTDAVHIAARFAERRAGTLPALSAILLIAGDDGIKLRATNLETGIDLKLAGQSKEEGVVAIPAHVLQQVASSLAGDGTVDIEQSGDVATITSGLGKSSIKTVPYDDFPSIPFPEKPKNRIVIPGVTLKNLFTTIASCASPSTIRPELASVYFSIEGGTLTAVATDSFRLAEKKVSLSNKGIQGSFLIPAKNALEIAQALPDEDVILSFDENQCAFVSDGGMLVSRLTNATYPDYRQIIPKESVVEAVVLRRDLETALKRTMIFSDAFQKVKLSFDPKAKTLALFARNADIGESTEAIPGQIIGSALDIAFNHRYLMAALSLTAAESVSLTASGVGRPLVIRGVGDHSLLYLVSPMNQ
jgi:DNA polymerase III subunit beta